MLDKSFFKVEGATLLSVAPGVESANRFPYELSIDSLDGKKGTVKVNGVSGEYNFEAPAVAKAKVESVTFDNYRQFKVTFSEEVDRMTAIDPANYYFEIVEGQAGDKLGAALGSNNKLSELPGAAAWFNWVDVNKKEEKGRKNIVAEAKEGKTVVTINLPEEARFAGSNPLKVLAQQNGVVKSTVTQTGVGVNAVVTAPGVSAYEGYTVEVDVSAGGSNAITVDHNTKAIKIAASGASIADLATMTVLGTNVTGNDPVTGKKESHFKFSGTANLDAAAGNATAFVGKKLGEDKELSKDVTVAVAVRNVKDKAGVRKIDTAVFPMLIKDAVAPKVVSGYKKVTTVKEPVAFNPTTEAVVEVEAIAASKDLVIEFDEPVYKASSVVLYVNNVEKTTNVTFKEADGTTGSDYEAAKRATIDLSAALGTDFTASNQVHNIKLVGVKDLADNITVPTNVEFNVKLIAQETAENVLPEILGAQQVGDNVIEVEWNQAGAELGDAKKLALLFPDGSYDILQNSGNKIKFKTTSTKVATGPRAGRFFSYIYFEADDAVDSDNTKVGFNKQKFINRTLFVEGVKNATDAGKKKFQQDLRLTKDTDAPALDALQILSGSDVVTDYEVIRTNNINTLSLKMKDVTPFGPYALESKVFPMKPDGSAIMNSSGTLGKIRVSYQGTDGIVRSLELEPDFGDFDAATGTLEIKLDGKTALLNEYNVLVEGATYRVEVPDGYFSDSKKIDGTDATQGWIDSGRIANKGFTSLAFEATVVVPGSAEQTASDIVPQTSKVLIQAIPQPSVARDEIEVEFKGSIDPKTLKDPANYTLNGKTLAAWGLTSADIKYIVDGPDVDTARKFARFYAPMGSVAVDGAVEFVVEGVANPDGAKMAPVHTTVDLKDNKTPVVIASKLSGSKNIVLSFDEAVAVTDPTNAPKNFVVKVDGQIVSVASVSVSSRTLTLVLSQDVPSPTSKIEIEVVKDNNNNLFVTDNSIYKNKIQEGTIIKVQ